MRGRWIAKVQELLEAGEGEAYFGRLLVGRWQGKELLLNPFVPRSVPFLDYKDVLEGFGVGYALGEGLGELAWARNRLYPGFPLVYGVLLRRDGEDEVFRAVEWAGGELLLMPDARASSLRVERWAVSGADLGRAPPDLWARGPEAVRAWVRAQAERAEAVADAVSELANRAGLAFEAWAQVFYEPDTRRAERKLRRLLGALAPEELAELLGA